MKTPLQVAFEEWLKENNAEAGVLIKAPFGGQVTPENFIPAGWTPIVLIVPKQEARPTDANAVPITGVS